MVRSPWWAAAVGLFLGAAEWALALPPPAEALTGTRQQSRPARTPEELLNPKDNPLQQATISQFRFLIANGSFSQASVALGQPKQWDAASPQELARYAVLCLLQRALQPGTPAGERLTALKAWRPLVKRFEPRLEPAVLGWEAHLLDQDQEHVLETLIRNVEGQQWGQMTELARDKRQQWPSTVAHAMTFASFQRLGRRLEAMADLERALQTPGAPGGLTGQQAAWRRVNTEALPAALARAAAGLAGLVEVRAADSVPTIDLKRLHKALADIEAQTSENDLGRRLRQDCSVKLFLLGQVDDAKALLQGPAAPDHAAALLQDLRKTLKGGSSSGAAAKAPVGQQAKSPPPGLNVLLSDEQKKRWLPPPPAAESSSSTLQKIALLEQSWRDRVAKVFRTEQAATRKECLDLLAGAKQLHKQIQRDLEADRRLMIDLEARLKRRLSGAEVGLGVYRHRRGDAEAAVLAALSTGDLRDRGCAIAHCNMARLIIFKGNAPLGMQLFSEAVAFDPDFYHAHNDRAWLLATDRDLHNGKLAVEEALAACEKSGWKDPLCVDTLAAAYAEAGRFDEAEHWQYKAMFAPNFPKPEQAGAFIRLYDYYRRGKPYRTNLN